MGDTRFNFFRSSEPCHAIYLHKLADYRECAGIALPNHRAPPRSFGAMLPLQPYKIALIRPLEGIMFRQLGIMKLTSEFVARYGMYFFVRIGEESDYEPSL